VHHRPLILTALAILALDRATKFLVVEVLNLKQVLEIPVAPGFLALRMAWNRGVNFGLLAGDGDTQRFALAGLALAVSAGVAVWAIRRDALLFSVGAGALIGGALGNAWDRLTYGAVADFLNVTCCGLRNPFAFNVADVAIFAGAVLIAFAPERRATS
jgi:signal peptidase II